MHGFVAERVFRRLGGLRIQPIFVGRSSIKFAGALPQMAMQTRGASRSVGRRRVPADMQEAWHWLPSRVGIRRDRPRRRVTASNGESTEQ